MNPLLGSRRHWDCEIRWNRPGIPGKKGQWNQMPHASILQAFSGPGDPVFNMVSDFKTYIQSNKKVLNNLDVVYRDIIYGIRIDDWWTGTSERNDITFTKSENKPIIVPPIGKTSKDILKYTAITRKGNRIIYFDVVRIENSTEIWLVSSDLQKGSSNFRIKFLRRFQTMCCVSNTRIHHSIPTTSNLMCFVPYLFKNLDDDHLFCTPIPPRQFLLMVCMQRSLTIHP